MAKLSKLRIISLIAGIGLIVGLTSAGKGIGTYCNVCPVGFLQITVASRSIPVGMILGVSVGLILIYAVGRFFCAWLCPSALVKSAGKENKPGLYSVKPAYLRYLPYLILAAALIVSFIVQFPVFCLVCPVGLFFGFIFALFRLFHEYDPTLNLIIFPLIITAELLLFKKWCAYVCPISAVFTLLRKIPGPKLLKVNCSTCLHAKGVNCHVCAANCPEGLEITSGDSAFKERCSSCMTCRDKCPTKSIHLF